MSDAKRVTPRRWWAAAVIVVAAMRAWGADAPAQAAIPVESFFQKPAMASAVISPDGRHVAMTVLNKDGLLQLVVLDTATLKASVAASFDGADVINVHWVSDKRVVYGAGDVDHRLSNLTGGPGLYAVDIDGADFRQLSMVERRHFANESRSARMLDVTTRYRASLLDSNTDTILVTQANWKQDGEFNAVHLLKLDTRTGASTPFQRPGDTLGWGTDYKGNALFATTRLDGGKVALHHFDGSQWTKLNEFDAFTQEGAFSIVGLAPDGTLFVSDRKGEGTSALYTYDLGNKQISEKPVLTVAGFDVHATLDRTRDKLLGFHYAADARATYWVDPQMKQLQAKLDKLMPATVNHIDVPFRAEAPFVVVFAYSDADPGQYFLYDTQSDKLVRIGRRRPAIDPAQMGRLDFVRYKARDGLEIPAWVTTPKGAKGAKPMVVLVHGGPWLRGGMWGWDPETQFLASRGYVVLEPEYRGSQGYGFKHFKAGWKQWGLAMQNDVADGVRWAIDKGIADPKRVCIAGASYGGYATLMGLVNDPDLYRCGIEWAGVTDIELMYSVHWSDFSDEYKTFGMPVLVADREKDAAQIKATSPIQQASRIKQPLLMGHGAADVRVPLKHGADMRDAVMKANKDVEWVVYPDEGHGWHQLKDNVDWWTRVEKFLARNIGDQSKQ